MNKCIYYNDGVCDVIERPCNEVVLCTPETIYVEKNKTIVEIQNNEDKVNE